MAILQTTWTRLGLCVLLALVAFAALACALQRRVLFPRPTVPPDSAADGRDDIQVARVGPDSVEIWLLRPKKSAAPSPFVIFTHGNAELIDFWVDELEPLRAAGVGVLLVEYPGYGRSSGSPSEKSITSAVTAAYDFLVAQPDVDRERIAAWGRSLGGGAACALARDRALAALILESTFTSVRPFARPFGLVGPLLLDPFDNVRALEAFRRPLLVIHGTNDTLIPVEHGQELADREGAELHLLPCGHNDCVRPWSVVLAFLTRADVLRSGAFSPAAATGR